ncbi:MAG: hypothetical protein JXO51_02180 [Candidatus Aminicenantes bacterium]|nr:hypothetical protein [Candidatus Aminicenantes bacterium]
MSAPWIDYLFKTAVFLTAAYLFYYWLLRNDVNFQGNRLFLLGMLPLSFMLPLAPLRSPFRSLTLSPMALGDAAALPALEGPSALPLVSILAVLYWTGVAVFILRIFFHLFHLYRLQRRHPHERLRNITLVKVESPIPPFSFFNRVFFHNPRNCDEKDIEQIITHEAVHIRQLHSLDILIMELVVALQWFNPAVWFYRKALKETHEYLADREVIAQGFNADGYRLLLFEQQLGAKLFEFASHLKQSQIKRRMFMMNRMKRAVNAPYKIFLALPLVAFLALALAEPRLIMAKGAPADDPKEVVQKEEPAPVSEQELKETQAKFEEKEKVLKEKLAATEDPQKKQELKESLNTLYKKRQLWLTEHGLALKEEAAFAKENEKKLQELLAKFAAKEKDLKEMYASADSPEKKERIKKDLTLLQHKRQELMSKYGMTEDKDPSQEELAKKLEMVHEKRMKIKQLIHEEKDSEKAKELEMKFEELLKLEKELKARIDKSRP